MRNGRIALTLVSVVLYARVQAVAAEPPPDLLHKIAAVATANAKARDNYTYRQSLTLQEIDHRDMVVGEYKESRDVTFSPAGERYEQTVGAPSNLLTRIKMTPEDFADLRNVQPFFLTSDSAWQYAGQFKGEETIDGTLCFVVHVGPKQILAGQRYFEGLMWVRETDFAVLRTEGQAVPQIETTKQQNLFPHFTTVWRAVDGKWMFPVETYADDTLFFKDWPQRIRIVIRYMNYKKFGVQTTLTFNGEAAPTSGTPATAPPH